MSDSENGQIQSPGNNENDERLSFGGEGEFGGVGADDDFDFEDDERDDADGLNIKPPQATMSHSRDRELGRHGRVKEKINSKEKKHSKERRHKERSNLKERDRDQRERERSGGGGRGAEYMERYPPRGAAGGVGYDDNHEPRRGNYSRHFEGGARGNHYQLQQSHYHHQEQYHHMQQRQQQQHHHDYYDRNAAYHNNRQAYGGNGGGKNYHDEMRGGKNQVERGERSRYERPHDVLHERDLEPLLPHGERERERIGGMSERERERERDRRKYAVSGNTGEKQPPVKDAESLEQDLRSRLLSKRHKYVRIGGGDIADDDDDHYDDDRSDDAVEYTVQRMSKSRRAEKKQQQRCESGGVIELLDSPDVAEPYEEGEYRSSKRRHKSKKHPQEDLPPGGNSNNSSEKRKTPDDPELLARRARFLAAEREKELRKESAREELQARRELLRERERKELSKASALSPTAVAASVTAGLNVIKRKSSGGAELSEKHERKRRRADNETQNDDGERKRNVSDSDDESDSEDEDDDDDSDENDDDDDSESHSDSAASVQSVPPKIRRPDILRKHQQQSNISSSDHRRSRHKQHHQRHDNEHAHHNSDGAEVLPMARNDNRMAGNVSSGEENNAYVKRKLKKKRRKNAAHEGDERDLAVGSANNCLDDSSVSSMESEDSFYAKRKRGKHPKATVENQVATAPVLDENDDDESSRERAYYKAAVAKSKKTKRKAKAAAADNGKSKAENEDGDDDSLISDGSVKRHRARKLRRKHSSLSGDEIAGNVHAEAGKSLSNSSENSELESDYEKKRKQRHQHHRRHHHRHHRQSKSGHDVHDHDEDDNDELARGEQKRKTNVNPNASDVSSEESEDEFENGIKNTSGSDDSRHKNDADGGDIDAQKNRRHPKRNRRLSDDASQFMADINEEEISSARHDRDTIDDSTKHLQQNARRRGNGAINLTDNELEMAYDEKGEPLPNYFPGIQGCRTVEEFQWLNRIEEGTYGVVYRARDQRTNEIVALKRLKMEKEREGFPITSLREINTLLKGQHPNIVTVREIVVGSYLDKIYIVMDYVEHDLKSLMETMKARKQIFFPGEVKCLAQQLLRAVSHLHDNWILHRDLKTSNLLLSHKGILKVADFGLAREYGSPLRKYTSLVVTRWYRAPELLLCSPMYSTPIDIWSVGCIFAEFLLMTPYLPGKSDIDQLNRIFKELGTPNEKIWPGYNELPAVKNVLSQNTQFADYPMSNLRKRFKAKVSETGISLLQGLLTYDPKQRLTAEAALDHAYFKELPLPIDPAMFPTWPAKSELGSTRKAAHSPQPPSGGAQFKQLGQDDYAASNANANAANTNTTTAGAGAGSNKVVSGIITGNKKTAANTGFVLNAGNEQRQLAMGPGFNLKF